MWLILIFSFFTFVAFYSLIFSLHTLCRKGVAGKARNGFMIKHGSYTVILLVTWTVQLLQNYYHLFRDLDDSVDLLNYEDKEWLI